MKAGLLDKCIAYTRAHRHRELAERTIWEVFDAERRPESEPMLCPVTPSSGGASIEIQFAAEARMRITGTLDVATLKAAVAALRFSTKTHVMCEDPDRAIGQID